ncbi:SPOR domain-containing protein [Marinimicrobium sp. ABcell2]|uniref:SPOR domain-containing protein n=1 Tax=Marinimicrobium sp. ABcell2 TaxID=3069751 RepID=UPI0027B64B32|nr:SPOR domain-containing protein [Marinimicrobium sp. ABcell2]MDQ2078204.1 SPOR domain-containing protein [Marinimicrobium sp. ABcell2]
MRAICLAVVVINILVLGAQLFLGSPDLNAETPSPANTTGDRRLVMLSERSGRDSPVPPQQARVIPEPAPAPARDLSLQQAVCALVGPFDDSEQAEHLVQRLISLEVQARIEEIDVPAGSRYWVHLEPELSQNAALRRLHELQAKNIDSYIIPRGELALGISLGMYSRPELAERRKSELQALDYDARILEISRTHRETWVSLPSAQASQVAQRFWSDLLESHPHLEKRQNLCPGVASEPSFH